LLPETVLKHISSINQFLKQQKGGKYVYATCLFVTLHEIERNILK
jgi:hypothetical protein